MRTKACPPFPVVSPLPRKTPVAGTGSSLARLATARSSNMMHGSIADIFTPSILKGDRNYLRALRAAEMLAWAESGGDALRRSDIN